MFSLYMSGLPVSAKDLLFEAMKAGFGEDVVELIDLTKESLKSSVRLSAKNSSVVLVVLDRVSSDMCSDIEQGLYSSGKYYLYTSDKDLAEFLNTTYGCSLVVEEEVVLSSIPDTMSAVDDSVLEELKEKIAFKEAIIVGLNRKMSDLILQQENDVSSYSIDTEEFDSIKDENIRLKNSALSFESELATKSEKLAELETSLLTLKSEKMSAEKSKNSLVSEYKGVVDELTKVRVAYSKQSGLIRNLEVKIKNQESKLVDADKVNSSYASLESTISNLKEELDNKQLVIVKLKGDLEEKERDCTRYIKELSSYESKETELTTDRVAKYKDEILELSNTIKGLNSELSEKDIELRNLSENSSKSEAGYSKLVSDIEELKTRAEEDSESISILNKDKLELQAKVEILQKSVDSEDDKDMLEDYQKLRLAYDRLANGVFGKISSYAMPNGSSSIHLVRQNSGYKNIRFAFSGSTESRKGAYRCLLNEFKAISSNDRFLIIDLVSETCIDYVFEINKVTGGMDWFRKGGSVQPFLSNTCLKNTQVLSAGLGYVNDSYFLCVDWDKRLYELENSGYKVVIFCGDISNIVGRVLHESFAGLGTSVVYVHGNAVGSRNIITNMRGISNSSKSILAYFDYNNSLDKFYKSMQKTNECTIISSR